MQLAELETILAISRTGSMNRAAAELHLTEPAISARVRSLEAQLGVQLFERRRQGMTPTPAGRTLIQHAEQIIASVAAARRAVEDVAHGRAGELVIAAVSAASAYVVPELITRVRAEFPGIRVAVRTAGPAAVLELVRHAQAHVGLLPPFPDRSARFTPLYEEDLLLVARPGHELTREPAIPTLAASTLVVFDRSSLYHRMTLAMLGARHVEPASVIEVDSIEAARRMVTKGAGVSFIPGTGVAESVARGDLRSVVIDGLEPVKLQMAYISGDDRSWGPVGFTLELMTLVPDLVAGARRVAEV